MGHSLEMPLRPSDSLRLVTWNVEHGLRVTQAIEAIEGHPDLRQPHVVLLQEMAPDGTERIAEALGMHWVYAAGNVHSKTGRDFGNAVLSRAPLELVEVVELPHSAAIWGEDRVAVGAACELGGRRLILWSVHAEVSTMRFRKQLDQYDVLASAFRRSPADLRLMTGDFNSASRRNISGLVERMRAAGARHITDGIGPTFRRFGRDFVLDHVFGSGFRPTRVGVAGPFDASDHKPVFAELAID